MGARCSGSVKATAPRSNSVSAGNASRASDPASEEGPTSTVPGENKSSSLVAVDGIVVSSAPSAGPTGGPTATTVPATEEAGAALRQARSGVDARAQRGVAVGDGEVDVAVVTREWRMDAGEREGWGGGGGGAARQSSPLKDTTGRLT